MKIRIDREKCIGCGSCEAVCPQVFKILEDGKSSVVEKYRKKDKAIGEVSEELASCVKRAEEICPVGAIESE